MDKKVAILIIGIVLVVVIIGGNLIAKNMKKNVGQTNETQTEIENEFSQTFEDGTKLNTSTKLKEVKKLDNLPLDPGKSTQLNTTTQEDYTNIYDFKIVKK